MTFTEAIESAHTEIVRGDFQFESTIRQGDACRSELTAKSLFQNILRIKYLFSIFYGESAISSTSKPLRINNLAESREKN